MLRQHGVPAAVLRGIAVSPSGRLCRRGGNSDSARTGTERAGPTFPEQRFLPEKLLSHKKNEGKSLFSRCRTGNRESDLSRLAFSERYDIGLCPPAFRSFSSFLAPMPAIPQSSRSRSSVIPYLRERRPSASQPFYRCPAVIPRPAEFVLPETGGASEPPPLNLAPSRRQAQAPWPSSSVIPRAPSFFPSSFPSSAGPGSVAAPPVSPERAQGRFRHAVPPSAPRRRRRRAGTDLRSARSLVAHALFSGLSALRSADTGLHFDLRA